MGGSWWGSDGGGKNYGRPHMVSAGCCDTETRTFKDCPGHKSEPQNSLGSPVGGDGLQIQKQKTGWGVAQC